MVMASLVGRFDLVRRLLSEGADPSSRQWMALRNAAQWREVAELEWIFERCAPPNSALDACESWAVGAGHVEVVEAVERERDARRAAAAAREATELQGSTMPGPRRSVRGPMRI